MGNGMAGATGHLRRFRAYLKTSQGLTIYPTTVEAHGTHRRRSEEWRREESSKIGASGRLAEVSHPGLLSPCLPATQR
jgi:hypothetical protein